MWRGGDGAIELARRELTAALASVDSEVLSHRTMLSVAFVGLALTPSRPCVTPPRPPVARRAALQQALALTLLPSAASAAEKKPSLKEVVAQLDASIPKDERNINGPKETHFPKIAFEGSQGQGKKVVFTVPLENLSPPDFDSIEYMWIKDANDGTILTARKFRPSEPDYTITAFGSSGQKLTAASKDDKFGIWEGTFVVP